jgi:hypothetical protein
MGSCILVMDPNIRHVEMELVVLFVYLSLSEMRSWATI